MENCNLNVEDGLETDKNYMKARRYINIIIYKSMVGFVIVFNQKIEILTAKAHMYA